MLRQFYSFTVLSAILLNCNVWADTLANCSYADALGSWILAIGGHGSDCKDKFKIEETREFSLREPNVATGEFGNVGTWTLIYNQGIEINMNHFKFFLLFDWDIIGTFSISVCQRMREGYLSDSLMREKKCLRAIKKSKNNQHEMYSPEIIRLLNSTYDTHAETFVAAHNEKKLSWRAKVQTEGKSLLHLILMSGGLFNRYNRFQMKRSTALRFRPERIFPAELDWRNKNGVNFVSPIRNQGACGSCYAFASAALLEARLRVFSNNTFQRVLSTQDIIDCSPYSQGCAGGFSYLVAGKYAEMFGLINDADYPYKGLDGNCHRRHSFNRTYSTRYRYIGGYYGACSEAEMIEELQNGPIAVAFEVYPEFMHYHSGVYYRTGSAYRFETKFDPFVLTNHAVLVAGYGVTASGIKYWIVKNSWGTSWGMNGYFKIRRGTNECGIESEAVAIDPIFY